MEGSKSWMRVITDLKVNGMNNPLIAAVDAMKGFSGATTAPFQNCIIIQTCIVHLIRYSMQLAFWKERKAQFAANAFPLCHRLAPKPGDASACPGQGP